jgi:predicted DNA-binding protein (MmcQ/YjbR family)
MDQNYATTMCRSMPQATEGYPFGEGALVFKVGGKVFAIIADGSVSLKCDPGLAVALRQEYPAVTAGYHLNKRHWNTVKLDDSVPDDVVTDWIQDSYELVAASLPRGARPDLQRQSRATRGFPG